MKRNWRMKKMKINHGLRPPTPRLPPSLKLWRINLRAGGLVLTTLAMFGLSGAAFAVTSTSPEFRLDMQGMGPWEMRTAAASEAIAYSTAWATNLTAAQQSAANAVVKVYSVKREKPKYIAIDLSGGTAATHYPIEYLDDVPAGGWTDEYKTTKLVLRHIPAGTFIMGGRETDYPGAVNTNLHLEFTHFLVVKTHLTPMNKG